MVRFDPPTDDEVNSACLSYDHSFGLMNKEDQDALRWQAREWLHAWRKEDFDLMNRKERD